MKLTKEQAEKLLTGLNEDWLSLSYYENGIYVVIEEPSGTCMSYNTAEDHRIFGILTELAKARRELSTLKSSLQWEGYYRGEPIGIK
jgi:hypothetical protein